MSAERELVGSDAIMAALAGQVKLASEGIAARDFHRWLGYDDEAVWKVAREAAAEEFAVLPGLPVGIPAEGPRARRLRALSRSQREAVREALAETFVLAFFAAATLERGLNMGGSDAES